MRMTSEEFTLFKAEKRQLQAEERLAAQLAYERNIGIQELCARAQAERWPSARFEAEKAALLSKLTF